MPFNTFLDTETASNGASYTVMKSPAEIRQALTDAIGEPHLEAIMKGSASVATTCGSGMTAAVLWLGLKLLGVERIGLYDEVRFCGSNHTRLIEFPSRGRDTLCDPPVLSENPDNLLNYISMSRFTASQ